MPEVSKEDQPSQRAQYRQFVEQQRAKEQEELAKRYPAWHKEKLRRESKESTA